MARMIDHVVVRGEGGINCEWTVVFDDRTKEEYYSIDQELPKSKVDDQPLEATKPKLASLLMDYWARAQAKNDPDEDGLPYKEVYGVAKLYNKPAKARRS